ncbi:MAG TPA: DUF4261 domain-containing protein [Myxococcales bacterium]|nr:DUF4261 domain-containing protein [Myxococcales bacterium]
MESLSFTQCVCVLFARAPRPEDVARALADWPVSGHREQAPGDLGWAICGPGTVVDLRGEGFAVVDVVDRPWPDDLEAARTMPALGGAWRAGAFGPHSRPGALARALDQLEEGSQAAAVADHGGFVRLRTAVVVEDGPPQPRPGGPAYDLLSLTELAESFLPLPDALALFVPAGEALRSRGQVEQGMSRKVGTAPLPIELWSSVRAIALPPAGGLRWLLMDVVGMNQLGLPDQEAVFAAGQEQPEAVEPMLRNACLHLISGSLPAGSTSDDARGRRWRASAASGIVSPSRPVLRWLPEESARPPEAALASLAAATAGTDSSRETAAPE